MRIGARYRRVTCTAATPCPLYVFLTGTGMKIIEPELMLLREMTDRGFVGGFVAYPTEPYYPQSNGQWAEKAQIIWQGANSALAVLCSRAAVDCDLGIAVHGFSQGAGLASLAAQYDSRVSAALLFGIGTCVLTESSCAQGNGVHTVLQASVQSAYLPVNVRCCFHRALQSPAALPSCRVPSADGGLCSCAFCRSGESLRARAIRPSTASSNSSIRVVSIAVAPMTAFRRTAQVTTSSRVSRIPSFGMEGNLM